MSNPLIVTVGSNPLPVVISILALKPPIVHLVYTPDVSRVVNRICEYIKENKDKLPDCQTNFIELRRHTAEGIREKLVLLRDGCRTSSLNYTGGTKLMAVHTHEFWSECGGQPANASYLGADGKLYFDDPKVDPISEDQLPALSLAELCQLHFGKRPNHQGDEHLIEKRLALAKQIHQFVSGQNFEEYQKLLPPLYGDNTSVDLIEYPLECPVKCSWNAAKVVNFASKGAFFKMDLSLLFKALDIEATNIEGFSRWLEGETYTQQKSKERQKTCLKNAQWLYGGWLEVWLADQLSQARTEAGVPLFKEIHQNVVVGDKPDDFEMDVVAVQGYRLFLFSCTVDDKKHLVKSKFFEAANRTARIGGEHARAAMVCLYPHPQEVLMTVQEEHWQGYDTLRLFGAKHVQGKQAPCQVTTDGTPHAVNLLEGIKEWVLT